MWVKITVTLTVELILSSVQQVHPHQITSQIRNCNLNIFSFPYCGTLFFSFLPAFIIFPELSSSTPFHIFLEKKIDEWMRVNEWMDSHRHQYQQRPQFQLGILPSRHHLFQQWQRDPERHPHRPTSGTGTVQRNGPHISLIIFVIVISSFVANWDGWRCRRHHYY